MSNETGAMYGEFVQGGGALDDVDVTIVTGRYIPWDYKGKIAQPVLGLQLKIVDAEGGEHEEVLSAGDLKFFVPSADGKKAIPVGSQQFLNINTNAIQFILSLKNADTRGELAAKMATTDDVSTFLDNLGIHVVQKAQPKRATISAQAGPDAALKTRLDCSKINRYPWEAAGAAPAAKAPASAPATQAAAPAAAAPAAAGGVDVNEVAMGVLLAILGDAGGTIKKTAIAGKAFGRADVKALATPVRNAMLALIVKDDFLGQFGYDAATQMVGSA